MSEKTFVFDNPKNTTQYFNVSLPEYPVRLLVKRTERIRKLHHMGCTDGLPPDYQDSQIRYEVTAEVPMDITQKAIEAVRKELGVDKDE